MWLGLAQSITHIHTHNEMRGSKEKKQMQIDMEDLEMKTLNIRDMHTLMWTEKERAGKGENDNPLGSNMVI